MPDRRLILRSFVIERLHNLSLTRPAARVLVPRAELIVLTQTWLGKAVSLAWRVAHTDAVRLTINLAASLATRERGASTAAKSECATTVAPCSSSLYAEKNPPHPLSPSPSPSIPLSDAANPAH